MKLTKYSERVNKFLKQEYGSEDNVIQAIESFKKEAKDIMTVSGIEYTEQHDVLIDLYCEYRIYSAMGTEKLAILKLESFNKLLKTITNFKNTKEVFKPALKGVMIFND